MKVHLEELPGGVGLRLDNLCGASLAWFPISVGEPGYVSVEMARANAEKLREMIEDGTFPLQVKKGT